ncbi:MAG: toprim domain-containing protein [Candidatus Bathyarchaeia archaeon]
MKPGSAPILPSSLERKLESLMESLQKLSEEALKGVPVVVEGRKDSAALRRLGIRAKVVRVKSSGKVLADVLDGIEGGEVILMVDFDRDGVELAKQITTYLEGKRVKVNSLFWKEIGALVKRDVKDVEGLPSFLEKLKKKVG